LARVFPELQARPNHAVTGMQIAIDRKNCFSLTAEWLLRVFCEDENMPAPMSRFATSNGLALRRADFQKCGGFDPSFPLAAGEDREFSRRWIAAGFHIIELKEAALEHHFPRSFLTLMKQQWRYGRGVFHYHCRVYPSRAPRIRTVSFYMRMAAKPLQEYGLRRGALIGMLCWLSQGMIACGYLRERIWSACGARVQ
jgi:GT2 family glycosyltransferase